MNATRTRPTPRTLASARCGAQAFAFVVMLAATCVAQQSWNSRMAFQSSEPLPSPSATQKAATGMPDYCQPVDPDPHLSELTVDISPRAVDKAGQVIRDELVPSDMLPADCAKYAIGSEPAQVMVTDGPSGLRTCDLLPYARFCHHPLYFNDEGLERYGIRSCCVQPAASAARFYGGALLMPLRVFYRCPCSCVSTPPCDYCDSCCY